MFHHMGSHTADIFKKPYMTKLVQFIMTDRLDRHLLFNKFQIFSGSRKGCHTGTREGYFGCGNKFICQIRITGFFTFFKNFQNIILILLI